MKRVALALVVLAACKSKEAPAPAATESTTPPGSAAPAGSAPAAPASAAADIAPAQRERAQATVATLKKTLVGRLTTAMGEGVPQAIAVCNVEAPQIAGSLSTDGVTVGRATRKPRNPANAAAGWQADALAHFEQLVADKAPLAGASFATRLPDGRVAYAEPLVIQELCLACHGASLAPEVQQVIAQKYPSDQATGYALGELRGVAWVELPK